MKKQLLLVCMGVISLAGVKCKNESNAIGVVQKRDTVATIGVHLNYGLRSIKWGVVNRITADSLMWVGTDSTTMKKKMSRITYYEVIVDVQVDSAIAKQFNVPLIDSTGKPNVINLKLNAEAKYVRDSIYDLNAAIKSLEQYVIKDSSSIK